MAGDDENPYTMPVRPGEGRRAAPAGAPGGGDPAAPPPAPGVRHGPAVAPPAGDPPYMAGGEAEPGPQGPRRRTRLLPLLIAFLALAGFAAIVWYAYSWGTGEVPPEELPVVRAERDLAEVKERPEEPGGMQVPHQDAQLLNERGGGQTPADSAEGGEVERLLPPPESPQPPEPAPETATETGAETGAETATETAAAPATGDLPTEPPAAPTAGPEGGQAEAPVGQAAPAPDRPTSDQPDVEVTESPVVAPQEGAPAAPETAQAPQAATEAADSGDSAGPAALTPQAEPAPDAAPEPAPETTAAQPSAPEPSTPAAATPVRPGDWVLQMAALRDRAAVEAEWGRLQNKHADLLGGLSLAVQTVEVTGKGTFYRLQAGPLPNRATAEDLCGLLQAQGTDCLPKQH